MRLLLCQPNCRLDVHHQILVTRARQALHQLFQLGTLQRHFADTGLGDRQLCGRLQGQFLGRLGRGTGLCGLGTGIRTLARQLLLNATQFLPQQTTPQQGRQGYRPRHHQQAVRSGRCLRRRHPANLPAGTHSGGGCSCLGGVGRHCKDSMDASSAGSVGRDSHTTPKPAARAVSAIRLCVTTVLAAAQD